MAARVSLIVMFVWVLVGCSGPRPTTISRIVLIAPFEGRYREIGYQSLYASRLAIQQAASIDLELLAIDDGGTVETAYARVQAVQQDNHVQGVLLVGPFATHPDIQPNIPHLRLGTWQAPLKGTDACDDICQLGVFRIENPDLTNVQFETTSPPVMNDYREAYAALSPFTPAPLPIARLTYEATRHMIAAPKNTGQFSPGIYTYTYTNGELIQQSP